MDVVVLDNIIKLPTLQKVAKARKRDAENLEDKITLPPVQESAKARTIQPLRKLWKGNSNVHLSRSLPKYGLVIISGNSGR